MSGRKVTPGSWYWLGDHSLVANYGNRPVVLTGRDLRQRDPETGLLEPIDPLSPDMRLLAASPELRHLVEDALAIIEGRPPYDASLFPDRARGLLRSIEP